MCNDDETTTYQLHRLLSEKCYSISLHTILQCRTTLGWTFRGSTYSQTTPVGPRWVGPTMSSTISCNIMWPTHCSVYVLTGLSIQPRCTCGQGSAREDVLGYVFLIKLWRKSCLLVSWSKLCYHSSRMCTQTATNLCKIILLSTHHRMLSSGLMTVKWIGGKCQPSHRI